MSLTELNDQGIMWVNEPVRDILGPFFPSEGCMIRCGTMLCKDYCTGGFCFVQTAGG